MVFVFVFFILLCEYDESMCLLYPIFCEFNHWLNACMQVLVTSFGELEGNAFLDPRTAQVAVVDHVKQVSPLSA